MYEKKSQGTAAILRSTYNMLITECLSQYPQEACGVLAGLPVNNSAYCGMPTAAHIYPVNNAASNPETAFRFQPDNWINAFYEIQRNQQTLVGFFHSHPHTPAVPSLHDKQGWPFGTAAYYWIVSLADPAQPILEAYKPIRGEAGLMFAQIGVEIT